MESITIKDVARICGVGVSTVSRAINNHPDINPETKEMIMQVIKENHYVPNNSARNLKRSDARAIAIVKGLCDEAEAKYQIYVNRSDIPGGSTVGSISSAMLPMRTMDVGLPLLAMHSARVLMGANDQEQLNRLMNHFLGD